MTNRGRLIHILRNTPVRELVRALERDGFERVRIEPLTSNRRILLQTSRWQVDCNPLPLWR